uniref:G-protein coupled receptors family 1 profile domain-containing protein n=1 Tax=Knipowitschia caucasica TaxID=637954 RepID=A0AAV2LS46_KNICA
MYFYLVTASVEYSVAFPVNLWAFVSIVSNRRPAVEREVLILNLLLSEILCSLCFLLWLLQFFTPMSVFTPLINFYQGSMSVARTLFQWHLCTDRYLAVVHPIMFIRYRQVRYRVACLVPLWTIATVCGLNSVYFPMSKILVSLGGLCVLAPSLSTETMCSLAIARTLRRPGPGSRESGGSGQKRRAVRITALLALMAVLNNISFILFPVFDKSSHEDFFPVALALGTMGSSTHGFLYMSRARRSQRK